MKIAIVIFIFIMIFTLMFNYGAHKNERED